MPSRLRAATLPWRSKEMLERLTVRTRNMPVSCVGRNPLGIDVQADRGGREHRRKRQASQRRSQRPIQACGVPGDALGSMRALAETAARRRSDSQRDRALSSNARTSSASASAIPCAEATMAATRVNPNSRNRRPTMSGMNSTGISAAISATVIEMTVNPICRVPLKRGIDRLFACLDQPRDVLDDDHGIVDDEADRDRHAINEILSRLKPRKYITTNVRASDTGMVTLGMTVAQNRRKNSSDDQDDQDDGDRHGELDVGDRRADQQRAVVDHVHLDRRRYPAFELRQRFENFVDGLDDVGVWLS